MNETTAPKGSSSRLASEIGAGLLLGILASLYSASYGALLFTGPLAPYVSTAVGACLFSAFALGAISAVFSRLPGSIPIPQDAPIAILAASTAAVGVRAAAEGQAASPEAALAFCAAAALLTALTFVLIGQARLSRILRFVPYPVVGGLVAGTGWLIVRGAFTVLLGRPLSIESLQTADAARWIPSLLCALVLLQWARRKPSPFLVPSAVLLGTAAFYGIAYAGGLDPAALRASGWLLGPFPAGALWYPPGPGAFADAFRALDSSAVGNALAMTAMAALAALFNLTGIELSTGTETDLDGEIRTLGWANVVAAAGGGCAGYSSMSLSALAGAIGIRTRLAAGVAAGVCAAAMLGGAAAISYAPRPVLGGLLVFMGLGLLERWLSPWRERLPTSDRLLMVGIVFVVAFAGFLSGVGAGVLAAAALFAVEYGRVNVVRHELTAKAHRSRTERSLQDEAVLEARGDEMRILRLQGYLFFGSAHRLVERIIANLARDPGACLIAIDMKLVTGLDSSALLSFTRLRRAAAARGAALVWSNLPAATAARVSQEAELKDAPIFPDLDHAVEWWEERALAESAAAAPVEAAADSLVKDLGPRLTEVRLPAGDALFQSGDPSDGVYFIVSGKVEARLPGSVRLQTLGPGTMVGEMGLYTDERRSASVVAVKDAILLHLSRAAFDALSEEDPAAERRLHRAIMRLLAERLRHSNRERALLLG